MKFLRVPLCGLLLMLAATSARAEGGDPVVAQVRGFYQWYVTLRESAGDENVLKGHRKEMARYVTADRLAKLARLKADSQEGDYFLNSLDNDPGWAKNIEVTNVKIDAKGRATAVALLIGEAAGRVRVKVTLVQEGGTYKISAVDNLPDNGVMAAAQLRAFYVQYLHYRAYASAEETLTDHQDVREGFTKACLAKATADPKADYLLQSNDLDSQWENHVEVKPSGLTPDSTSGTVEVLLTGEKIPKAHLKVSLRMEGDAFKIDGVEKTND